MMKFGTPWAVDGPGSASMKPGLLGVGEPSALRSFLLLGLALLVANPHPSLEACLAVILRAFSRSWLTRSPLSV